MAPMGFYVQESMCICVAIVKIHNALIGAGLCAAATAAAALSLGPAQGEVALGSVVDLRFAVVPDAGEDVAASCVTARVVAGGAELPGAQVRVTPVAGHSMVRVQTLDPVAEPILDVTLAAGCQGRIVRTYTFLARLPSGRAQSNGQPHAAEYPAAIQEERPPAGAAVPEGRTGTARPVAPTRAAKAKPKQALVPARQRKSESAEQPQARADGAAPQRPAAPGAGQAARLVMEPLDLSLPEAPASLRLTPELSATADPARRAEAAATWRALNQSPADVRRFDERLDKLEADARTWRQQIEAERAANVQLRERLVQLQASSFSAGVVYALLGLLLLALAVVLWLLLRSRSGAQAAWQQAVQHSGPPADADAGPAADFASMHGQAWAASTQTLADAPAPPRPARTPVHVPDVPSEAAIPAPVLPADPAPPAQRIVHPEELLDTLQQAEFFISVGEHEQAIAVLRQHIAEHGETSPVAYLELLRLLHTLGRAQDFAQLGTEFQQHFNIRLPAFARFHERGRGLFGYPQVLAAIEAQWPLDQVLQTLRESVFQKAKPQGMRPFEPAAFEDLLLLLSIAQTVPAQQRGASGPRARTTPLEPSEDEGAPSFDSLAAGLSLQPSGFVPIADKPVVEAMLDVDLTEPPPVTASRPPAAAPVPAPQSGQPVGFGMHSDRFEASFELEEMDRRKGKL